VLDGLLIIDKPSGPTSHDVVARLRRVLREPRIGHTGTLDPLATGVLLLVIGKATRLAKFLSASDKSYEAVVRLGFATDTADALGRALGPVHTGPTPSRAEIDAALDAFRGTFRQQPPAFSAKKIDGQRSYKLARARRKNRPVSDTVTEQTAADPRQVSDTVVDPQQVSDTATTVGVAVSALPAPVSVTAHAIRVVSVDGDQVTLSVDCSAGFYIRSLAHDLGERLGTGAHLTALRRTRTGVFTLDQALTLHAVERDPRLAAAALLPLAGMLPGLPSVVLTAEGINRVAHGQDIRPHDQLSTFNSQVSTLTSEPSAISHQPFVRLLDTAGALLAIAQPEAGDVLHPSVVLV
jgi:tRNA pseudouridine55 synthase